ncbi:uncharacterized protein LOC141611890 [Silene latifolia]|uniref:uncharacterized protein LOC141611890 n=1 Tax=Silene latifolia TaxID=37657 RepID=UPI003D76F682
MSCNEWKKEEQGTGKYSRGYSCASKAFESGHERRHCWRMLKEKVNHKCRGQKMVKKRHRKEGTKLKEVEGHGSPAALYYVIEHLSTTQRKDVEDIGFGGLLELKCGGQTVPAVTDDKEVVQFCREKFGVLPKKDISLSKVKYVMLNLVQGGPDFKTLFVVFAMGSFLVPTVHNRVDVGLIAAVEDVAAIPNMDWCSHVLERFDHAVDSWKSNDSKSMGGCLMFFELIYFHRLVWRGDMHVY